MLILGSHIRIPQLLLESNRGQTLSSANPSAKVDMLPVSDESFPEDNSTSPAWPPPAPRTSKTRRHTARLAHRMPDLAGPANHWEGFRGNAARSRGHGLSEHRDVLAAGLQRPTASDRWPPCPRRKCASKIQAAGLRCESCHFPFVPVSKLIWMSACLAKELGLKQMIISTFSLPKEASISDWMRSADEANKLGERTARGRHPAGIPQSRFRIPQNRRRSDL